MISSLGNWDQIVGWTCWIANGRVTYWGRRSGSINLWRRYWQLDADDKDSVGSFISFLLPCFPGTRTGKWAISRLIVSVFSSWYPVMIASLKSRRFSPNLRGAIEKRHQFCLRKCCKTFSHRHQNNTFHSCWDGVNVGGAANRYF